MGVLDNKGIVVTGASRGLGESMAVGFAREGAALVLAARTESDLERVAALCRDAGGTATTIPTDITDEKQVVRLIESATQTLGKIDVFVANAGIANAGVTDKRYRELTGYDLNVLEGIFKVNVFGTFTCMREALNAMGEGSSFITIGSETGRVLYPGAGMYAVSKSTLDALSILASREMAQKGIRVNVLSPGGMVDTKLFGPNGMPEMLKQQVPPLPDDVIVPAAVWLASDDSKDVTGALISGKEFNSKPLDETKAALAAAAAAAQAHRRH